MTPDIRHQNAERMKFYGKLREQTTGLICPRCGTEKGRFVGVSYSDGQFMCKKCYEKCAEKKVK